MIFVLKDSFLCWGSGNLNPLTLDNRLVLDGEKSRGHRGGGRLSFLHQLLPVLPVSLVLEETYIILLPVR
jgi:hypothetical protein